MILESGVLTATNTDVMSTGRLNAIPYNGRLVMQFLASEASATNHFDLTIQKPNGDVPIDAQICPAHSLAVGGVLDSREWLELVFDASQGGHFTVNATETGTALLAYRFVLSP